MGDTIELSVKVFLFNEIKLEEVSSKICRIIDDSLVKSEYYSRFHKENKFKNYSFNMLYPLAKNGIYEKENLYTFLFRTVDKKLAKYLQVALKNQRNNDMQVLVVKNKNIPRKHIESIYAITPIVTKFESGYWKRYHSIEELERRIKINLIKKYNEFYNVVIEEDFEIFTMMTITNNKPISTKYKNITLLGDKINFKVADNEQAQKIANFAIGTGMGEMTSRGLGFINYRWL